MPRYVPEHPRVEDRRTPIVVRMKDGTNLYTNTSAREITDRLLAVRYNDLPLTINDQPVNPREILRVDWPTREDTTDD